ncbi:MAG: hypothetical protein ABI867_34560 [Kofleriaceae bacterium]
MHDDVLLDALATRYVWWQPAARTLARRAHFLCQLMQLGTPEDVREVRRMLGDEAFREALRNAPAGILDARSWNFWHLVLLGQPPPPLPERQLPR